MNVGIVGLSHLGLVTGAGFAESGANVIGFDPDESLVETLNRGDLPVHEAGLRELLFSPERRVRFVASPQALGTCEVVYLAKDVPTDANNVSQLEPVRELFDAVLAHLRADATVVIHSQVSPGFTRALALEARSRKPGVRVVYQVETLVFGIAVERALRPERYIVGVEDTSSPLPSSFGSILGFRDCPVLRMSYESAELAKIAINLFLVSSLATTSVLSELCEEIGANWHEIVPALRLDRRIGQYAYLQPGLGIAGGNLERDLLTTKALAAEAGSESGVVDAWLNTVRLRRDWALNHLLAAGICGPREQHVALWGLSYKPGTHSLKNAPSIDLIDALADTRIVAYDPLIRELPKGMEHVQIADSPQACLTGASALVVMNASPIFAEFGRDDLRKLFHGRVIVDPFGVLVQQAEQWKGVNYFRLGAPRTG